MRKTIHIGRMIRAELDRHPKQHTVSWFAAQLHTNRRNAYDIFSRADLDTALLRRICQVLDHDFFADISVYLADETDE